MADLSLDTNPYLNEAATESKDKPCNTNEKGKKNKKSKQEKEE